MICYAPRCRCESPCEELEREIARARREQELQDEAWFQGLADHIEEREPPEEGDEDE